jgi:hypothetical protein
VSIRGHPCFPPSATASSPRCQMPRRSAGTGIGDECGMGARHPASAVGCRPSAIGHRKFSRLVLNPEQRLTGAAPSPLSALSAQSAHSAQPEPSAPSGRSASDTPYPSIRQSADPSIHRSVDPSIRQSVDLSIRSSVSPDDQPEVHLITCPATHFPPSPPRLGIELHGMRWDGIEWNGMVWHGMPWRGMAWTGRE